MKEKQIEEMAKEIFNTCAWRFGNPNDYKEIFNDIAEDLNKLNYKKVNKDSVVFTKEEHNLIDHNIKHLETVCNNLEKERNSLEEELSKYKERELYSQSLTEREWVTKTLLFDTVQTIVRNERNQTRKETAEKIYTFVNSFGTNNWERFTKFIKQFGVEIKE